MKILRWPGINHFGTKKRLGKFIHPVAHLLVGGGWRRTPKGIKTFELYCIECKKKESELT
jgi:hypothetical protein